VQIDILLLGGESNVGLCFDDRETERKMISERARWPDPNFSMILYVTVDSLNVDTPLNVSHTSEGTFQTGDR
jgi:hypothetical protein